MSEIAMRVWEFTAEARSEEEIVAMLMRSGVSELAAPKVPGWCAGKGYIRIHDAGGKRITWEQGKVPEVGPDAE